MAALAQSGVLPLFGMYVNVNMNRTNVTKISNAATPNNSPRQAKNRKSVVVAVLIAIIAAAVVVVGLVSLLVVSISRHFFRVVDESVQSSEVLVNFLQVIQRNVLTPNGIHRSNIDFSKVIEAVAETSNITLKTKFSTYYKAIMPSGSFYFAKKLNWSDKIFPMSSLDKFKKELDVLAKLNNSNVMIPLAYFLSTDNAYILYEFVSVPSLTCFMETWKWKTL